MKDLISKKTQADVNLIRSNGGVFEIKVDGNLVFSKKSTGQFPTDEQIDNFVKA